MPSTANTLNRFRQAEGYFHSVSSVPTNTAESKRAEEIDVPAMTAFAFNEMMHPNSRGVF